MVEHSFSQKTLLCATKNLKVASITESVMWISLWMIIMLPITSSDSSSDLQCCSPKKPIDTKTFRCADNGSLRLDCSIYICMDTKLFTTTSENSLVDLTSEKFYSSDSFCLTTDDETRKAILCLPDHLYWEGVITITSSSVSLIFCIGTLFVYFFLPKLRDFQDKSVMCLAASYGAFYLIHILRWSDVFNQSINDAPCSFYALFEPFALIASVLWMTLISFRVWQSVWFLGVQDTNFTFLVFAIVAWGVPACFMWLGCITDQKLLLGHAWSSVQNNGMDLKYLYVPILILFCLNILFFGMTLWRLRTFRQETSESQALKAKSILMFRLVTVMWITWIFEILMSNVHLDIVDFSLRLISDCMKSLHGLWIFIAMVVTRGKVKKLLAGKKLFCISFPESWLDKTDPKCSQSIGLREQENEEQLDSYRSFNLYPL